jgi:phosphohistidine phosphatase
MDLYIIRHAEAQALGEGDIQDDEERPLTPDGQFNCGQLAAALKRHGIHFDRIVTSPLLRARQTADGLLRDLPSPKPELHLCDHLAPGGRRKKLTRFLSGLDAPSIAIVGHMPDLADYAAWLIGSRKAQLDLAKAGVASIHFDGDLDKGMGALTWMVTPKWYK